MKEIIYNLIEQGDLYIIIYKNYNIDKLKVLLLTANKCDQFAGFVSQISEAVGVVVSITIYGPLVKFGFAFHALSKLLIHVT